MILVLMLPNGECHINSYRLSNGNYRTICFKTVEKGASTTTLSADNTFEGICQNCKSYFDEMYLGDLNESPEIARSISTINRQRLLDNCREELIGPEAEYGDLGNRKWWRLNKYKKLISRPTGKPKKKNLIKVR